MTPGTDRTGRAERRALANRGKIKCDRCRPNRNENAKRAPRSDRYKNHR